MRVVRLEAEPFYTLQYSLGPADRSATSLLPFHRAVVEGLPETLDAIVATGDLQGIVKSENGSTKVLGEALACELEVLRTGGELGPKDRTAALLAGDFHAHADEADVRNVWW